MAVASERRSMVLWEAKQRQRAIRDEERENPRSKSSSSAQSSTDQGQQKEGGEGRGKGGGAGSLVPSASRAPPSPLELAAAIARLPMSEAAPELTSALSTSQVVIVVGETGSGKSTQVPKIVRAWARGGGASGAGPRIGCTQPRRMAAVSLASRVADEVGTPLGKDVGYAVRFDECMSDTVSIKFMTDGILLREASADRGLDGYAAIVVDEVHERSLNTDVVLGLLRQVVATRHDFRVVIMSATLDSVALSSFFGNAPIVQVPGRTFPVDVHYSVSIPSDYVEAAVAQVLQIHATSDPGDILVFMTGQEDVEGTCDEIRDRLAQVQGVPELWVLPVYSALPPEQQRLIFEKHPDGARKCVVATNVAETSLTIDGIRYVIDPGFSKVKEHNPRIGMDALQARPISRASAVQRSGRAGRTGPGKAWRLYTEAAFVAEMRPAAVPEIHRANLSNVLLLLKSLGVDDCMTFPFLDKPPADMVHASLYSLWALGALDDQGRLTDRGRLLAALPLDPSLGALVSAGVELGCVEECLTIVSMLSASGVFMRPKGREDEAARTHEKFSVPESDHMTLVHVFEMWDKRCTDTSWAREHFLDVRSLRRAGDIRQQLADQLVRTGRQLTSARRDEELVRRAIASAFYPNAAKLRAKSEYVTLLRGTPCAIHPSSVLAGVGITSDYVVYHELVLTTREYMRTVTAVDPRWLAEYGGKFFSVSSALRASDAALAGALSDMGQAPQGAGATPTFAAPGLMEGRKRVAFASSGFEQEDVTTGTHFAVDAADVAALGPMVKRQRRKEKGEKKEKKEKREKEKGKKAGADGQVQGQIVFGKRKKKR
jgi:pre-mRNA-splicing factor ATP-dependent RNA helicase DHX38/PRP16